MKPPSFKTEISAILIADTLPTYVAKRSRRLGIDPDTYLSILLRNYVRRDRIGLAHVELRKAHERAPMPVSLSRAVIALAKKTSKARRLSISELFEALIVWDAWYGDDDLPIVFKGAKPRLTGIK